MFTFPQAIFVHSNSAGEQLDHIFSEVDEIQQLGPELEDADDVCLEDVRRKVDLEVMDLMHSCQTYLRIRARDKGADHLVGLFNEVIEKNRRRGYYEEIAP